MNKQKQKQQQHGYTHLEQILSDEVRYLHSLWHSGPPSSRNPNLLHPPVPQPVSVPQPQSQPQLQRESVQNNFLGPSTSSIQIQKKKKKKPNQKKKKNAQAPNSNPQPEPVSDIPWPTQSSPEPQSGWGATPSLLPTTKPPTRPASAAEAASFAALKPQKNGIRVCEEFFAQTDEENSGSSDEEEEEPMDEDEDIEETEEYEFFLGVFEEDNALRGYYEKNYGNGAFCCLVCMGNRVKLNKRYKNCLALAQHSRAIYNTKRKRAHRAFGQVICKVLGWDINQLHTIVLPVDEPLGRQPEIGLGQNDGNDQNNNLDKELVEIKVEQPDNNLDKELLGIKVEQPECMFHNLHGPLKTNFASDQPIYFDKDVEGSQYPNIKKEVEA